MISVQAAPHERWQSEDQDQAVRETSVKFFHLGQFKCPYLLFLILIVIPQSSAGVETSYGQCNLSSLRHEIPRSSAVGSFMTSPRFHSSPSCTILLLTSLCPGARPDLLNPPLWCWGWQALLWYPMDAWESVSGPHICYGMNKI